MFKPIGTLISTIPLRSKDHGALMALQVRQVALGVIKEECADLPVEIIESIGVVSFKSGALTMRCPTLVSAELQMRSSGLIARINRSLGRRVVSRIRFKVS